MTKPTPKPKKPDVQRGAAYARGGDTKMFGRGDRTRVAVEDSAGRQTSGITSQKAKSKPTFAGGGGDKMVPRQAAERAMPGKTGKKETPAGSPRASGGLSRPARPGECGT
jgi:hypothetical protein